MADTDVPDEITGESRDGTGSGDHDSLHVWGQWRVCLTPMQQARLVMMRGLVRDMSHAPQSIRSQLRFSGDSDSDMPVFIQTKSGLFVPQNVVGN